MSECAIGRCISRLGTLVLMVMVLGCSSISNLNKTTEVAPGAGVEKDPNTNATDDSPYARAAQRQVGSGFSFDIFGGSNSESATSDPAEVDPEYAEYLEWKRWQEFKAYQAWKAEEAAKSS